MRGQALLVIVFGQLEQSGHGDFGGDAAAARSRQFDLEAFGRCLVGIELHNVGRIDGRMALRTCVTTLAHALGWTVFSYNVFCKLSNEIFAGS
jgi:hypothetical protein